MTTRNLRDAQDAFAVLDPVRSRIAHSGGQSPAPTGSLDSAATGTATAACEPGHETSDSALKVCVVFGAFEGVVVAAGIVAALSAVDGLSPPTLIAVALACVTGVAVGLLARDYIRYRAYEEFYTHERKREKWELSNYREGEVQEMIEVYESKGLSKQDATAVINTLAKYETFFVQVMMDHELELPPPDGMPILNALGTFASFIVFGLTTVGAYAVCLRYRDFVSAVMAKAPLSDALTGTILCALWTTIAWAVVKRHMLEQHRGRGLWMQFMTFTTCFTVVFLVRLLVPMLQAPVAALVGHAGGIPASVGTSTTDL